MNNQNKSSRYILILVAAFLIVVIFGCLFGAGLDLTKLFPKSIAEERMNEIKVGELRDDVIARMTKAWHHGECKQRDGSIYDIFLFGVKEFYRMDIVVVKSKLSDGKFRVVDAGSTDRDMLKQYGLDKCIPAWILTPAPSPSPTANDVSQGPLRTTILTFMEDCECYASIYLLSKIDLWVGS